MNMQYAIENGKVFVLEANPRAYPYRTACVKGLQCAYGADRNGDHYA